MRDRLTTKYEATSANASAATSAPWNGNSGIPEEVAIPGEVVDVGCEEDVAVWLDEDMVAVVEEVVTVVAVDEVWVAVVVLVVVEVEVVVAELVLEEVLVEEVVVGA